MVSPNISLPSEAVIQSQCVQWFWNTYPERRGEFFAITNNSQNALKGAMNKAMGVVSGVADTCLVCSSGRVLWIEFKTPAGKQSPAQIKWFDQVTDLGHTYLTCRSLDEFKEIVKRYI